MKAFSSRVHSDIIGLNDVSCMPPNCSAELSPADAAPYRLGAEAVKAA
jgi:hypothetical protein